MIFKVARGVFDYTSTTLLCGAEADEFALNFLKLPEQDLSDNISDKSFEDWKTENNCQPNFWINVSPDPRQQCGPYVRVSIFIVRKNYLFSK